MARTYGGKMPLEFRYLPEFNKTNQSGWWCGIPPSEANRVVFPGNRRLKELAKENLPQSKFEILKRDENYILVTLSTGIKSVARKKLAKAIEEEVVVSVTAHD